MEDMGIGVRYSAGAGVKLAPVHSKKFILPGIEPSPLPVNNIGHVKLKKDRQ